MKLAFSNIAWLPEERIDVYKILQANGFEGLEIAPGLLLHRDDIPIDQQVKDVCAEAEQFGLAFVSMQSLHFGVDDAQLFGEPGQQAAFFDAIDNCSMLATRLGIRNLVVGSPKARAFPPSLSKENATAIAVSRFQEFAERIHDRDQVLAIEPNPAQYGTNFLTTMDEAIGFVRQCNHPAVCLNFDIGALKMNDEFSNLKSHFEDASQLVSHIHISESELAPVTDQNDANKIIEVVSSGSNGAWVSIEMRRHSENTLAAITTAAQVVSLAKKNLA